MSNILMKFIAKNPPSIAILGGILLMLTGDKELGIQVFNTGVGLQGFWLIAKYVLPRALRRD